MTRLLNAPKAFWNDPALAVFQLGYYTAHDLRQTREYGNCCKSLIYHHLRALAQQMTPPARLYFWRTQAGGSRSWK